jgi:hypothetical protein
MFTKDLLRDLATYVPKDDPMRVRNFNFTKPTEQTYKLIDNTAGYVRDRESGEFILDEDGNKIFEGEVEE